MPLFDGLLPGWARVAPRYKEDLPRNQKPLSALLLNRRISYVRQ
jgi:hypothetical protein